MQAQKKAAAGMVDKPINQAVQCSITPCRYCKNNQPSINPDGRSGEWWQFWACRLFGEFPMQVTQINLSKAQKKNFPGHIHRLGCFWSKFSWECEKASGEHHPVETMQVARFVAWLMKKGMVIMLKYLKITLEVLWSGKNCTPQYPSTGQLVGCRGCLWLKLKVR